MLTWMDLQKVADDERRIGPISIRQDFTGQSLVSPEDVFSADTASLALALLGQIANDLMAAGQFAYRVEALGEACAMLPSVHALAKLAPSEKEA